MKTEAMKTEAKIRRRRVSELVVERLEALAEKQRLRMPVPRRRAVRSASGQAKAARIAEAQAKMEAWTKKQSLTYQARRLTERICVRACSRNRRSFDEEARTRKTGPCLRCLDRSEARLLRLVHAWAEAEAQKEADGC